MTLIEYNELLSYISQHDPGNDLLPRLRDRGMTITNIILINKIYDYLSSPETEQIVVESIEVAAAAANDTASPTIKEVDTVITDGYSVKLRKLFSQRARLSNTFHISAGAQEDYLIADQIKDVQDEIKGVMEEQRYYDENGTLPPLQKNEEAGFDIPSDPFELIKKWESVRTSLAHRKKSIKKIDPKKEAKRYEKTMETIHRLTQHKIYLENAKSSQQNRDSA